VTTTPSCRQCHCQCCCQYAAVSQSEPPPSYDDSQRDHAPAYTPSHDVTAWHLLLITSSDLLSRAVATGGISVYIPSQNQAR